MSEQVSSNALLPCPFCGGTARMATEHDPDGMTWHYITCGKCGARSRGKWHSPGNDCPVHRAEVRDEWNRRAADEPSARQCNHGAISPKGTMFYHGFVDPKANMWRCDVCNGVFEGNLTDPSTPGSQALTLVGPSEPPTASREQQLLTELAYWKARCGVMHGDETNAVTKSEIPAAAQSAANSGQCESRKAAQSGTAAGASVETSAVHKAHDPTCGVFAGMACDCGWLDEHR